MVVLLVLLNGFNVNVNVALLIASALVCVLYWDTTPTKIKYLDDGIKRASVIIMNTAAVVGFGYGNRHFWCRGYYVSTVGKNRRAIEQYIRNQLQEDYTEDQMSIKEYVDPFTGESVKEGKWK